jgi:hypothetical protein
VVLSAMPGKYWRMSEEIWGNNDGGLDDQFEVARGRRGSCG